MTQVERERERLQKDKEGYEIAQGQLLGHVLANEDAGRHLIDVMLRPTQLALDHQDEFERTGHVDLGTAAVTRTGNVGTVELRNPRYLNAEDDTTTGPFEAGIDLLILDPQVEIAVLRGGVVEHPRYAGRRIFGAGLNLTHLYRGQISYLFFPVRDLGLVHKVYRGLSQPETEKLWIAAAETFAIGGGCQLLLAVDHILAEEGMPLHAARPQRGDHPRRREPAAAALRRRPPRPPGDPLRPRAARPRSWPTTSSRPARWTRRSSAPPRTSPAPARSPASPTGARCAIAQEPLDIFRAYMATYCREQAVCHFSPALIRNLEENWRAHERQD